MEISNWIHHHAKCSPDKVALFFEDQEISYLELEQRIALLAGGLVNKLGIKNGNSS